MALTKIDDRGLKTPIDLLDNEKIRLGTGNDLEIYHDGSNSYLTNDTGILNIQGGGANIQLQAVDGESGLIVKADDAVELYYNGSKKLETTNTGINVIGSDGVTITGLQDGTADLFFHADGGDDNADKWYAGAYADGTFHILNYASGSWEETIKAAGNGAVELYYDNDKKFETRSNGIMAMGSSGDVAVNIKAPDNISQSRVIFSDATNTDGIITYDHNDRKMHLGAGTATATDGDLIIDSSGNVGIGTTSPVSILHLHETGSDGSPIIQFSNGDTGATTGDGFAIGVADNESPFIYNRENTDLRIATNNTERLRILAGGGLTFNGDTAAANALDDYEEGTWTPVVSNGVTSLSYAVQTGHYTKVGKFIHCSWYIRFDATGVSSTHFYMGGLPYTSANTSTYNSGGTIDYIDASFTNNADQKIYIGNNSSLIYFYNNNGGTSSPSASYLSTSSDTHHIYGHVTYRTG